MYNLRKDDPRSSYNLCRKSPATGLRSETAITRTMAESPRYCPGNGLRSSLNSQEVGADYFRRDDPGPYDGNCLMPPACCDCISYVVREFMISLIDVY